jgi:pimeloyl-ACP methyl ester carboxylesterase
LVVVIPGIGGSELVDARGGVQWGGNLARFALNLLLPDDLSIGLNEHLTPTGLLSVAASVPGLTTVHPYNRLVKRLAAAFDNSIVDLGDHRDPNWDANIVAFAYDFRRSIAEAAERLAREIELRRRTLGGTGAPPKVIVVGHSMGGLIARYWMGKLGGWQMTDGLITLGTPHRGAPKALDWLVNGARVKNVPLDRATNVLRSWDSTFELLPRYPAVFTNTGAV